MKRTIQYSFAALALAFATACGSDDSIEQATAQSMEQFEAAGVQEDMENDALFAAEAASASMLQVQLGEAAAGMAVSPEVKGLAQEMVTAHQNILNDLREMATEGNFVLPSTLGEAHHKAYQEVTEQSGISFDLAYLKRIVEQNETLIDRYADMAEHGQIMALKQYASKQLPLLRQHQEILEEMQDEIDNI
ncbi:DUF4142 domain-containing protein [Pontibacter akesuensis]|uniref:Putative membrane protein n=1 Tax=Pontibacter akesuensis TaxID=388950 RepID=A0A1I7HTQ3_9BACT|nr:DUF4142 domain-containing protein [Pontibacter akesuensis]GHA63435.1 hypothetical protein GCM10007389_14960 [Pontibacter akesuensis]SFU63866.1 putative membrane protein [Pontibacter akesuensis]